MTWNEDRIQYHILSSLDHCYKLYLLFTTNKEGGQQLNISVLSFVMHPGVRDMKMWCEVGECVWTIDVLTSQRSSAHRASIYVWDLTYSRNNVSKENQRA